MRPVCLACRRQYSTKKVGVRVLQLFEDGTPYKIFSGDLYTCLCGNEIIGALAGEPISEHYKKDFNEQMAKGIAAVFTA